MFFVTLVIFTHVFFCGFFYIRVFAFVDFLFNCEEHVPDGPGVPEPWSPAQHPILVSTSGITPLENSTLCP